MDQAGKKKKKKPLRRAQCWGSRVLPMAGKLIVPLVSIIVMGLIFSALQALSTGLRLVLAVVIIAGMLLFMFSEGLNRGAEDAAASDVLMEGAAGLGLEGAHQMITTGEKDRRQLFHRQVFSKMGVDIFADGACLVVEGRGDRIAALEKEAADRDHKNGK